MFGLRFLCRRHKYVANLVRKAGHDLEIGLRVDRDAAIKQWRLDMWKAQAKMNDLYKDTSSQITNDSRTG